MRNSGEKVDNIHGVDGGFVLDVIVPKVLVDLLEEPGRFPRICESSWAEGRECGFKVDGVQHGGKISGYCAN